MEPRRIRGEAYWVGAVDWTRRLFDSLIPLPDGTSYNSYLVRGSEKTALLDTVDPAMEDVLMSHLDGVDRIDYVVSQHAEQDHSGSIPVVLEKYPEATVVCSPKAKQMLVDHLGVDAAKIVTVEDGEELSLGDRTLRFLHTPWVHWPETMVSLLPEERVLFSCDFLGSHVATTDLFAGDDPKVYRAARRYYAEIMMPFRKQIARNLEKLRGVEFDLICPSHGPIYDRPEMIVSAYEEWISDKVENVVAIPYISMHGSTERMVDHLTSALVSKGVKVERFELSTTDIGDLAMALIDAATIVIGTPTVHVGPHPAVASATYLANVIRPKARYAAIIGSYGWNTKAVEQLAGMIPNLKVEVLGAVMTKGVPGPDTLAELDALADTIAERHAAL